MLPEGTQASITYLLLSTLMQVESFMALYSEKAEFPVRVDIPLILTVSIRLAFKSCVLLDNQPLPASFFAPRPDGYTKVEPKDEGDADNAASQELEG
jgi:hypothetical protein